MKKLKKQAIALGTGAVGLSVGSQVLGGIGGNVAAKGQAGMQRVAGFFPTIGTAIGAGLTLRSLDILKQTTKKRRR